ncbi:hypothetical protein GCM10010094_82200 [Streptomyces flaveus]|uniref:Uncharacterized protein n=1 Tax=Streptomyces flaveus TaxID=66370 RepID=A0A917RJ41_9ACTN|nr:hypothetical protein GCM10010094_82200 [Streptomyces flaveus]
MRFEAAGSLWLVAQFPAPLKSKSLRLPAPWVSPHPQLPAASLRREGAWAGASYARRLGSVSEDQGLVPGQGRMPGLRRADAPAHDPDSRTDPRGAGNGATSHNEPRTRPTAVGNLLNRRRHVVPCRA